MKTCRSKNISLRLPLTVTHGTHLRNKHRYQEFRIIYQFKKVTDIIIIINCFRNSVTKLDDLFCNFITGRSFTTDYAHTRSEFDAYSLRWAKRSISRIQDSVPSHFEIRAHREGLLTTIQRR
ncbi:hypothetical protein HanIR_Chr04g0189381 [Helianthus annuus]|nr:hypothetical protein HanIR_Chr04g0189381 [Helianthus annuus]